MDRSRTETLPASPTLHQWHYLAASACVVAVAVASVALFAGVGTPPAKKYTPPPIDLYIFVGHHAIWAGDRIRYTVYDSTIVEARINSMGGELILILRVGKQGPGQYTLPFDGTMDEGTIQFAGKYQLELFFGEEYAAKVWFLCRPREEAS